MNDQELFEKWWNARVSYGYPLNVSDLLMVVSKAAFLAALQIGREEEREACAKLAAAIETDHWSKVGDPRLKQPYCAIAKAIRSRGAKGE